MDVQAASRIIGIQFSILSPAEIRRASVAEITNRDTYINNRPVIGGLFDPRMGTMEPGLLCPTDGLDYIQTPGYFGHIELARPLFYIQYLAVVLKILRCVCFKCSKLLLNKESHKHALGMAPHDRWTYVFALASKISRCGEDSHDGCGCKQPRKLKKEGFATLIAEWKDIDGLNDAEKDDLTLHLTPEICLKILRRLTDDDITFMGFSPVWSRPEWMICQVLAIPPPAVRPSVKHDAQQRSEDDLSHIIVNIIKTNKTLADKMQNNAAANIVADWTTLLQYYTATLVDNKIPGVAAFAQRSGRPLKSVKERMNGKHGRLRGNLMGKRVDYSARSVITPDPNLSISELGVPKKIAMNLTYPDTVNSRNRHFLLKLVQNGPNVYPGAKILEKSTGERVYLDNVDRATIVLNDGDRVHRHMLDGDPVLFNRQPTLHRMSMMCHLAKIMPVGDTFRMNVGDTKPYNADFDGDEMNLHMPQDEESRAELRYLAAVPWQIISPANNKSIVGIFQDSLLGSYQMTRKDVEMSARTAMNLLTFYDKVDVSKIPRDRPMTSFELLSQILPPFSLFYKTRQFKDGEADENSSGILEIVNGVYLRGQLDKGTLGDGTKGLIHRICNDFGNMAAADFIDDLQNIITEFMKTSAYSVGISDLIANEATNQQITQIITQKKLDVQNFIDETHLGIFENKSGRTNNAEFESKVNTVLGQALNQAGRVGIQSLSSDNRFVTMVKAGSKGSEINISQMVSCLGQQQVDGQRIPYGFDERTLPHFSKYDDSPVARGFVEQSFIEGLSPVELFFHAMGGRVGLIDTAVKTSQTGYIQRRLVKSLEDLKVEYDMTVRNSKNKIIQYRYGDDSFDTVNVEKQSLPFPSFTLEQIYHHFTIPKTTKGRQGVMTAVLSRSALTRHNKQLGLLQTATKSLTDRYIGVRRELIDCVFAGRDSSAVNVPVSLKHITENIAGQLGFGKDSLCDITPLEVLELVTKLEDSLKRLTFAPPTQLFALLLHFHLAPSVLLIKYRFNKAGVMLLLERVSSRYMRSLVAPGEMVGIIAAQSIGEPTTQMTLNTFHFAGVASKSNVSRGVPRIEEILSLSENPKNPSCTVYLPTVQQASQADARRMLHVLEYTSLRTVVSAAEICFEPQSAYAGGRDALLMEQFNTFESEFAECLQLAGPGDASKLSTNDVSPWLIRLELSSEEMLERNLTMDDVSFAIKHAYDDDVSCVFSDYNDDNLVFRIRLNKALRKQIKVDGTRHTLDQQDEIYLLQSFQDDMLDNLILRGVPKITKVTPRKVLDSMVLEDGTYKATEEWVLDTVGSNLLEILSLDSIDAQRTTTNDIQEVYRALGIEAARQAIFNEITEVIEFDNTYINYHHLSLLCDRMTCNKKMVSVFRHGINNDDIGPIAKASFEETPEMFLKAARHGELDPMRGLSANVMCGQRGHFGTNAFGVILDPTSIAGLAKGAAIEQEAKTRIEEAFQGLASTPFDCLPSTLDDPSSLTSLTARETGAAPAGYDPGF